MKKWSLNVAQPTHVENWKLSLFIKKIPDGMDESLQHRLGVKDLEIGHFGDYYILCLGVKGFRLKQKEALNKKHWGCEDVIPLSAHELNFNKLKYE